MLFKQSQRQIKIKTKKELDGMRRAGRLAARCLEALAQEIKPGISTQRLDDLVSTFAADHGATAATLGYRGYPKHLCTSVNEQICHGIPSELVILKEGDIVGVDVTLVLNGFYGDNASTVPVGEISHDDALLLWHAQQSLRRGIEAVQAGKRVGDIGHAIASYAQPLGFGVVRDFVGHGIGRSFHEEPSIPHTGRARSGVRLRTGMTFTIEPMINVGEYGTRVLDDGWTAVTTDGLNSAQYEHTMAVTDNGVELLTVQNGTGEWEPPGRLELVDPTK
jgi:methionyl aminopeptidase